MLSIYDGLKFYGEYDVKSKEKINKVKELINSIDEVKTRSDINEILELYNAQKIFEIVVKSKEYNVMDISGFNIKSKAITKILGQYFSKIDETNFIKTYEQIWICYFEDFFELIINYKVYNKIPNSEFKKYLKLPETAIHKILEHKELVQHYGDVLTEVLCESEQTAEIIVDKFLKERSLKYILPKEFTSSYFEKILMDYVQSEYPRYSALELISNAQSTSECPISDILKLEARHALERYQNRKELVSIEIGHRIALGFEEQAEVVKFEKKESNVSITYDLKWLEKNLDYSTILNNFIFVFQQVDVYGRSGLVASEAQIGAFEKIFRVEGKNFYNTGGTFKENSYLFSAQISLYYEFLNKKGIYFESIIKWFFEEYLLEEFNVKGFTYQLSSQESTYLEKCKNIASEIEGILKQFRMYVQNGEINRELFEISSEHMLVERIPSLLEFKYGYLQGKDFHQIMFLLFSNQSDLIYYKNRKAQNLNFCEIVLKEIVSISDFYDYQKETLKWLQNKECIKIKSNGEIKLNISYVKILQDFYQNEVLCLGYLDEMQKIIKPMIDKNELKVENTLFSVPEQNYINFMLNKRKYCNGPDLRNKYAHSTNSIDINVQRQDYEEFLKIMILIMVKINEEFSLEDQMNK